MLFNPRSLIDPQAHSDGESSSHGSTTISTTRLPSNVAATAIVAAKGGAVPNYKDQARSVGAATAGQVEEPCPTIFANAIPLSTTSNVAPNNNIGGGVAMHHRRSQSSSSNSGSSASSTFAFYENASERSRSNAFTCMVRSDRNKLLVAMLTALIVTSVVVAGFCLAGNCSSRSNSNSIPMDQTVAPTAPPPTAPPPTAAVANSTTLPTPPPLAENVTSVPPTVGPTTNPTAAPAQVATPVSTESPAPTTAAFRAFESTQELYAAVDEYVTAVDSASTAAAVTYGHPIGSWDVSRITDFDFLFDGATGHSLASGRNQQNPAVANATRFFNEDLSLWDVSRATTMRAMFQGASAFNSDISSWGTRRVTDMESMFHWAVSFNRDISSWDTRRVTNMRFMFGEADVFNAIVTNWNVGRVTNMWAMFDGADAFNQNLCAWRTRLPVNCIVANMFSNASSCPGADTPILPNGLSMCQICA